MPHFADAEVLYHEEAAAAVAAASPGTVRVVDASGCAGVVEELRRLDAQGFVGDVAIAFDGPRASTGPTTTPERGQMAGERCAGFPAIWLPVLRERDDGLRRLLCELAPAATLPVVPWPARDARTGDELLVACARFLEQAGVEPGDFVYASDRTPLDLYRSLIALRDQLEATYAGARLVLTPRCRDAHGVAAALAAFELGAELAFADAAAAGPGDDGRTERDGQWFLWLSRP